MTQILFAVERRDVREVGWDVRAAPPPDDEPGLCERRSAGPSTAMLSRSAGGHVLSRTRRQIREDATDLSVLWFVRRGTLVFSNQLGSRIARRGDLLIGRSTAPFHVECRTDAEGEHELLHLTVPTHVLRGFVDCDASAGVLLSTGAAELAIAETMVASLFVHDDALPEEAARTLVEAALAVIGQALRRDARALPRRLSISEQRFTDVRRFVEVHLSNTDLCATMTARACGISPRCLTELLRQNRTNFSELIWHGRLARARAWMARADAADMPISEIAYAVGFKSPAHFSRLFKRVYRRNPSAFRADPAGDEAGVVGALH